MKRNILIFTCYNSLFRSPLKGKALSWCVSPPTNLVTQATSISKIFPVLFLSFHLYFIMWPIVLILPFCLFFSVLTQSLMLLSLLYCVHLLIIWLMLPRFWPRISHSGFKSFLPSTCTFMYLVWKACSLVAIKLQNCKIGKVRAVAHSDIYLQNTSKAFPDRKMP